MGTTRAVIQAYMDALVSIGDFGQYMAEDVTFTMPDVGIEIHGREDAVAAITSWHQDVFDARVEVGDMLVDGERAAVELVFDAAHVKDFLGISPSGRRVRAPYAAFYELRDGAIAEVRVYGVVPTIVMQLTAKDAPEAATAAS
jgi:predicted ester cyclase